jgi:hypothetical protein
MSGRNKSNLETGLLFAALCIPLSWAGAGCCPDGTFPPCTNDGPTQTILVDETLSTAAANFEWPILRPFNPTAAGRVVTATVTGDITASRPRVQIFDPVNVLVANSPVPGTSNSVTVSFTSTNNGLHLLNVSETGTVANVYTVLVTEQ